MNDDDPWSDDLELEAEIEAELAEERQAAAAVLHDLFAKTGELEEPQPDLERAVQALTDGIAGNGRPYQRLATVTGWRNESPGDLSVERRWLYAAMASFDPVEEPDGDVELESAAASLTHYDHAVIVAGLVEHGVGSDAGPDAFLRALRQDGVLAEGDESIVQIAAEVLLADWLALGAVDHERRLTALGAWGLPTALHELTCADDDPDDDPVVALLTGARLDWQVRGEEWTSELYQDVGRLLTDVCEAPLRLDLRTQPAWLPLLEAVHEQTDSAHAAFLLAVAAELAGDVGLQSTWLDRALEADPEQEPALLSAAELASCRGDAAQALDLLRRADIPAEDEEMRQLRVFTHPPAGGPSRNSPCACGSGRKYKLCCGARGTAHPLDERSNWLWTKVLAFGRSFSFREQTIRRMLDVTRYDDDEQASLRALQDPLVLDAVLFEDGALQRFLDVRGPLLPPDERDLAETWLTTHLGLYEVASTRPGSSVHLRDIDGTVIEVRERTASRTLGRGDLLLARLLPTGGGTMLGPVLAMPRTARERAAAATTAQELYDLVAQLRRPPSLANTEGHELVPLSQRWRLPDHGWATLCKALEPGEDEEHRLLVRASGHVAASFRRTDDGVFVEVNSRERAAEVAELVRRVGRTAELLAEERVEAPAISGAPEPPTAEMQAALHEYMQKYEREWCDMEIPALGGRTPREAVRTSKGRAAVEDLLADMPETPNAMSARRLRALLALPTPLR